MGKRNLCSALEGNIAAGFVKDATVNHIGARDGALCWAHSAGGMDKGVGGDKAAQLFVQVSLWLFLGFANRRDAS